MGAMWLGCGDEGRTPDCTLLCQRYAECVEPIDGDACVTACEQHASVSRVYALAAVSCQDCIDGEGCSEASVCWHICPVGADE